jgi:hypothetical protein
MLDGPGLNPCWGQEIFLFAKTCLEPDKWPTQCLGALPKHKAAGTCEDHPPTSSAKVK